MTTRCPTCGTPRASETPVVYRSTSDREGGCSFCHRHITADGETSHRVVVVKGSGGMVVRFCHECLDTVRSNA